MLQAPAASSRPPLPCSSSSSSPATAPHKVGHQRRPSDLTFTDKDEGLLGVLNNGPQLAAPNAKTVLHCVSPAKRSAVVDQHILRSCQESVSHAPQSQPRQQKPSPSSHPHQSQQPPPPLLPFSSPAPPVNPPAGRFFTPGSFFSPPCTRVGLGTTASGGGISAGSSPALKKTQFSAESNHPPLCPDPERQRVLSHGYGTSLLPQPHLHQSGGSNGSCYGSAGHPAVAPGPSIFRPILTLMAATTTAMSAVESNGPTVVGLPPSWSNEDLPSPIYNHGSNDTLYRQGAVTSGAVFPNRSPSASSESMVDVAPLISSRGGSDDGGGPQLPLEIRIHSPGLSLSTLTVTRSSFVDIHPIVETSLQENNQDNSGSDLEKDNHEDEDNGNDGNGKYLVTTPLLDLQEQGYVVLGSVSLRDFEEEAKTRLKLLVVDTTISCRQKSPDCQDGLDDNINGDYTSFPAAVVGLESPGSAPLSAGLDERYWLPTMSIEDFGAVQLECAGTAGELQLAAELAGFFSESTIKQMEYQEEEETRSDNDIHSDRALLLFSDLLPIALKEMEHLLIQEHEVGTVTRRDLSSDTQRVDEDETAVIHVDFERLMHLCTEYEREKKEWRQLWVQGGGLELDLTFDDCELEAVKDLQQQQAEQEEILGSSCVIDMEVLLGCSWQQLQDKDMDQDHIYDNLPCLEGEVLLQGEHHVEAEEKLVEKEEKEGEVTKDTSLVTNYPAFGPMPLSKRVQFDPKIRVFEIEEDPFTQPTATEEQDFSCAEAAASPSPEWIAFKVFRPDQFTELSSLELSDPGLLATPPERYATSDHDERPISEKSIQECSRHTLSIATVSNSPPPSPSPLLDSGVLQTANYSPISASSDSSESSTSTLISQTETNYDKYTLAERDTSDAEDSFSTAVVNSVEASHEVDVLCSPSSPRTLELKSTRMQLQYWIETAARLRDREVILTDKIDELVQDMVSILDIYQDAELGRQATEMIVQELKQELVKEQEIGFASIQEAALSIQEKQVLEIALAASWSELQLLREALSLQKTLAVEEQQPSGEDVEETEETENPIKKPVEEMTVVEEPGLGAELSALTRPLQKSIVSTFMKQASLALVFVFATTSLLVLLCGHQHQLHMSVHTVGPWISNWSHLSTEHIQLEFSQMDRVWQHSEYINDNLSESVPVLSSMKEWQSCLRQSEQARWLLGEGCQWARGHIHHWTVVFETLTELWMDLTPMDVWRGYQLGLLRS